MKIAVFGGTGFVGSYIIDELLNSGYDINILVRNGSENKITNINKNNIINGDINDSDSISNTLEDCEAVIYNIGIIREFPSRDITFENLHYKGLKAVVDYSKKKHINRFILMSANGVKPSGTGYQETKYKAEIYLRANIRDWTIIRPSLIFGDSKGKDEFCSQLKRDMLSLPFPAPAFFSGINFLSAGKFEMSPVHVKDVAKVFVNCINNNHAFKKVYELGYGKYNWKEIISIISSAYGKNKMTIPAPVQPIYLVALLLDRFKWFPISCDQLTMLLEGNTCDGNLVFKRYNINPIEFKPSNLDYLSGKK